MKLKQNAQRKCILRQNTWIGHTDLTLHISAVQAEPTFGFRLQSPEDAYKRNLTAFDGVTHISSSSMA